MQKYIPGPDDEFDTYLRDQFVPYATANAVALGLTPADTSALNNASIAWGYAWVGYTNLKAAYAGAVDSKDGTREDAEDAVRAAAAKVQANPSVTDEQKENLGITVRKSTRTPVPVPSSVPAIQRFDTSTRGILRLFVVDATTPDSSAKPFGVQSCEIREQIGGTAPVNPNNMTLLANETRFPYRADYGPEEIGQTVYFAFRWVNTRGQWGRWSGIYSAMVPG